MTITTLPMFPSWSAQGTKRKSLFIAQHHQCSMLPVILVALVACSTNIFMPHQLGDKRALSMIVYSSLPTLSLKKCVIWILLASSASSLSRLRETTTTVLLSIGLITLGMHQMRLPVCGWSTPVLLVENCNGSVFFFLSNQWLDYILSYHM